MLLNVRARRSLWTFQFPISHLHGEDDLRVIEVFLQSMSPGFDIAKAKQAPGLGGGVSQVSRSMASHEHDLSAYCGPSGVDQPDSQAPTSLEKNHPGG